VHDVILRLARATPAPNPELGFEGEQEEVVYESERDSQWDEELQKLE
jgi:hypothetical protein